MKPSRLTLISSAVMYFVPCITPKDASTASADACQKLQRERVTTSAETQDQRMENGAHVRKTTKEQEGARESQPSLQESEGQRQASGLPIFTAKNFGTGE
jgi:hypothetical protein